MKTALRRLFNYWLPPRLRPNCGACSAYYDWQLCRVIHDPDCPLRNQELVKLLSMPGFLTSDQLAELQHHKMISNLRLTEKALSAIQEMYRQREFFEFISEAIGHCDETSSS